MNASEGLGLGVQDDVNELKPFLARNHPDGTRSLRLGTAKMEAVHKLDIAEK